MVPSRQLIGNIATAVVPLAIVLVTIPAYIGILGEANYGVLAIVWVLFGYAGVLDLGMSRAVNGAISRAAAEGFEQRQQIIWSGVLIAAIIGIGIAAIVALSYPLWSHVISADVLRQISPAVPYMVVGIPLLTITSVLNGAIEGAQRFDVANYLQIGAASLYQVGPLVVAYLLKADLTATITAVVASRLVVFIAYVLANQGLFGILRSVSPRLERIRELIRYGHGIALVNILDPLLNRADQFLVAYLTGPAGVASYNIAVSAVSRMSIFPMALSRSIFPVLSSSRLEEYVSSLINMERRVLWIWFAASAAAILACGPVFDLWLGRSIGADVTIVARTLIPGLFLNSLAYLPYTALQAEGRGVRIMRAHLIELPIFLVTLPALAIPAGPVGAAVAWSLRAALDFFILWKMSGRPMRSMATSMGLFMVLLAVALLIGGWAA